MGIMDTLKIQIQIILQFKKKRVREILLALVEFLGCSKVTILVVIKTVHPTFLWHKHKPFSRHHAVHRSYYYVDSIMHRHQDIGSDFVYF